MHFAAFPGFSIPARDHRLARRISQASMQPLPLVSAIPIACGRIAFCNPVLSKLQSGRAMIAACREGAPVRPGFGVALSPEISGKAGALSECRSDDKAVFLSARLGYARIWVQLSLGKARNHRDQAQLVCEPLTVADLAGSVLALRARIILVGRRRTGTVQRLAPDRQKRKRCRGRGSPRRHAV